MMHRCARFHNFVSIHQRFSNTRLNATILMSGSRNFGWSCCVAIFKRRYRKPPATWTSICGVNRMAARSISESATLGRCAEIGLYSVVGCWGTLAKDNIAEKASAPTRSYSSSRNPSESIREGRDFKPWATARTEGHRWKVSCKGVAMPTCK